MDQAPGRPRAHDARMNETPVQPPPTPADPSLAPAEALLAALGSDAAQGLSEAEAARRLAADGPNELRAAPPRPRWRHLLQQFQDPLIYLLLAAVLIALLVWGFEGFVGWPVDALVITVIVVLNGVLGYLQEARAERAAAALQRLAAVQASVLREGRAQRVPAAALVRGDLLLLAEGDAVAADARLLEAHELRLLEAALTGESAAVLKHAGPLSAPAPLAERANLVFKGTAVAGGHGLAVVTATGMATEMGRIAALLEATQEDSTPLQKEVGHLGRMLGLAVVAIAVVVVATVLLLSERRGAADIVAVLLLGVSLAVAAVPEGLPAILSVVLALGVQRMAQRRAIIKKLSSVETLGSASVICSDKTGTLTRSEMTIERLATASGESRVSGVGYAPEGRVEHQGQVLRAGPLHAEQLALLGGGSAAGSAQLQQDAEGIWRILGDPTEAAFLVAERKLGGHEQRLARFERIGEIPFSAERRMMSVLVRDREHGGARLLIAKGAPDVLLARCSHARVGMEVLPMSAALREQALQAVERLGDAALRTLAVAYRPLGEQEDAAAGAALEQGLIFVGTAGIIDPPRAEAGAAIRAARGAGIRVIMITGDHPRTAARIAADLGLVEAGAVALTGAELDALDDAAFAAALREHSVYARVAPAHKQRIVDALQAQGHVVAMTGDGVNDAPALKSADIGVAMGITGSEVSKEAAKMILADDNFATIVEAVREGRGIVDNLRKCLRYLLSSNMGEVLTVFLGVLGAHLLGLQEDGGALVLPLLATQILWINLVTDSGPALAMGLDPSDADVMRRRPRAPGERIIDARMWWGVLQSGLVMALLSLAALGLYLDQGLELARTAAFTVLVFSQLFNCFNARSELASAFRRPFVNRWLWGAVGLSALLQVAVVQLPLLNIAFSTVPLAPHDWLLCLALGSGVLWHGELRKLWLRGRA